KFLQLSVYVFTEWSDVSVRAHLDGDRDGTGALPIALCVAPVVKVQISRRAVIASLDVDHVAQVNRRPLVRTSDRHVANFLFTLELAGRIDRKVLSRSFQLAA